MAVTLFKDTTYNLTGLVENIRRIVSMLEGGYNLAALGASAVAHVKTLAAT